MHAITSRDIPLPRVPRSALPDGAGYEDTGCEFARSCLACPFDACKYDNPSVFRLDAARRDREIARLRRDYRVPVEMLMQAYGLSRRHVYRALREHGATRPWRKKRGSDAASRTGKEKASTARANTASGR